MRTLHQLVFVAWLACCVAAPLALIASGAYGRAAAPQARGYVQLNVLMRDGLPPPSMPVAAPLPVTPAAAGRRS